MLNTLGAFAIKFLYTTSVHRLSTREDETHQAVVGARAIGKGRRGFEVTNGRPRRLKGAGLVSFHSRNIPEISDTYSNSSQSIM